MAALSSQRPEPIRRSGALVDIVSHRTEVGELVASLIANPVPGAPVPPILPPKDGFLLLDKTEFADLFAADVDTKKAAFMAAAQVPWGIEALNGMYSASRAWKDKPSWYLIANR